VLRVTSSRISLTRSDMACGTPAAHVSVRHWRYIRSQRQPPQLLSSLLLPSKTQAESEGHPVSARPSCVPAGRQGRKTTHLCRRSQRAFPGRTVLPAHLAGFFHTSLRQPKRSGFRRSIPDPRYTSVNSAWECEGGCSARRQPGQWSERSQSQRQPSASSQAVILLRQT